MPRPLAQLLCASTLVFSIGLLFTSPSRHTPRPAPAHGPELSHADSIEAGTASTESQSAGARAHVREAYGRLPLHFEANRGQTDARVGFIASGGGYDLFLTPAEAVLSFGGGARASRVADSVAPRERARHARRTSVLRMKFLGASQSARLEGREVLPGKSNYFSGAEAARWITDIPNYGRVDYRGIYDGVDLTFYGNRRRLEYDFVVNPGADPSVIRLALEGARDVRVDDAGELVAHTRGGDEVRQHKPLVYQEVDGGRREIAGRYVLAGRNEVGFEVGAYDRSKPLVIDPVLVYSSYLGGSNYDSGNAIAVDAQGNAYVTGQAGSHDFPTTAGAFQQTKGNAATTAFITKINPQGTAIVYSTYLRGEGENAYGYVTGYGIAVDAEGSAYVTGEASTVGFPTTPGAADSTPYDWDAFATKLNPQGSGLVYSTLIGGSFADFGRDIAIDAQGNAYVTGWTTCRAPTCDFPTVNAFQPNYGGGNNDAFVTKVNPQGTAYVYSTYLGGGVQLNSTDDWGDGIAVDAAGSAYVTGYTYSPDFPTTPGAYDRSRNGLDAFVTKFTPDGSGLVYSTFFGGSGREEGLDIALDPDGNAYVTGATESPDFPTTAGAFQTAGSFDAFVTKLNAAGSALVYSTYLGGGGEDRAWGIALDSARNAYVAGDTRSTDFPVADAVQPTYGGSLFDAFASKLDSSGTALVYSTYIGGDGFDEGRGVAVDSAGNAYVTGYTDSANFHVTAGAFQTTPGGTDPEEWQHSEDAFVVKLADGDTAPTPTPTPGPPTVAINSPADGATLYEPALVNIEATAAPGEGASITQVDFYANGNFVGSDGASPYHFSFGPSTAPRTFVLTAVATDTNGARTTSSPVTVNVVRPPNAQLWSQPTNFFTSIGPSAKSQTGTPLNKEVADDFDVDGTVERVLVNGASSINGAAVYGAYVRFYAWAGGAPGQMQGEYFVRNGEAGFTADSVSPEWLDLTLPTPFRATGKHFVSVQLVTDATFGWHWKSSDSGAGKRLSAVYVRDNLAGGAWAHTDYDGDGAFTLYGTPAGPPSISALSAATLPRAGRLVITGANFGSPQGAGRVLVGGVAAPVSTWTTNSITAYVPEGAAVGSDPVQVTTDLGTSNTLGLQVTERAPQDGRVRWRFQAEGLYIQGRPAVGPDGTVYAVDIGAHLYALTPSGALKWVFNGGPKIAFNSVSVGADNTAYFAAGNTVYAVNPDGTKRWEVSDPSGHSVAFGPGVGPDGNVYAQTDDAGDAGGLGLFSVTPAGQIRWNRPNFTHGKGEQLLTRDIVFGPPGQLYFTANNLNGTFGLYAYTLSGARRFVVPGSGQPAVAPNGNVYTVTGNMPNTQAEAAIYDPDGNLVRALFQTGTTNLSWPDVGPDNTAYFGQNLQSVVALNPDGSIRWTYTDELLLQYPTASPANNSVVVDGSLLTEQGVRGFVEAIGTNGQLLWRVSLPVENGTGITPDSRARFNADGSSVYVGMSTVGGSDGTQPYTYLYAFDSTAPGATPTPTPTPTAFGGTPAVVPGQFEAENFDEGGEGVAYHDLTAANEGTAYRQTAVDLYRCTDGSCGYIVGWVRAGEWLDYSVSAAAGAYTFEARASSAADGARFHVEVDGADVTGPLSIPNTGGTFVWATVSKTGINLNAGAHVVRVVVEADASNGWAGNFDWFRLTPATTGGQATILRIAAEDFDAGSEGVSYHDTTAANEGGAYRQTGVDLYRCTDGGCDYIVGWIKAGEWLKYTADIGSTGLYTVRARVSNGAAGGTFHIEVDGADVTGPLSIPDTGSPFTWTLASKDGVSLSAGRHAVRVVMDSEAPHGWVGNFDWIEFVPAGAAQVTFEAEDFDQGSEGASYHDTTAANEGGAYRDTGVDVYRCTDGSCGYIVGWIKAGEWLRYTADIVTAGTYTFEARVSNGAAGGTFHVEVDGADVTGPMQIPNTGSAFVWQNVSKPGLSLSAGPHAVRVVMDAEAVHGWVGNFDYITFTKTP